MRTDWSVRDARPVDAAAVREIARESWHAAYDEILDPVTVDEWYAIGDLEASITEAAERDDVTFLAAVSETTASGTDAEIDGFAHAGVRPDDTAVAHLSRLYVRPARWGDGAGTAVLERLEAVLRPTADRLRLTVLADNDVGISFYESAGFECVETRESDLAEGLEEDVYEKRFVDSSR